MSDLPLAVVDNAIASWWVHPLAVPDADGRHLWLSSIARLGTNRVHRVDLDTGAVDALALGGRDTADDHNAGAIAHHHDRSTLLVFYSRHGQDDYVRWRHVNRTTLAVSSDERRLHFPGAVTYAQVLQEPGTRDGRLVVLCRVGRTWQYRQTFDWGRTWGEAATLVDGRDVGQCYTVARRDPTDPATYRTAFYGHPASSSFRPVVTATIGMHSGRVYGVDGRVLGDLDTPGGPALLPGDLDLTVDPGGETRVRLLDVGAVDGATAVAYAAWKGREGDADYAVTRWDGTDWATMPWSLPAGREFGYTRAAHYLGGCVLTPTGGLVTARQDPPGELGGTWHVETWERDGDGFRHAGSLRTSPRPAVRPYAVATATGTGTVVVSQDLGHYDHYSSYEADLLVQQLDAATAAGG